MSDTKPFKSIDEQVQLLEDRGLVIADKEYAKAILTKNSYYRLSGYTLTLRQNDSFFDGITFSDVMQIYYFDSELRSLLLFALEHVEISLRTYIGYYHGQRHGPLGYMDCSLFFNSERHQDFINSCNRDLEHHAQSEVFIRHHKEKCDGNFPVWVMAEVLSFGSLSKLFSNIDQPLQQKLCQERYSRIPFHYIQNWLHCLSLLRNICAHRARLYNRHFSRAPKFSRKDKELFCSIGFSSQDIGKSLFFQLYILGKVINNENLWQDTLSGIESLIEKYPYVEISRIGFPKGWKEILSELSTPECFDRTPVHNSATTIYAFQL